ncbi:MAG TPA: squalene synthase HpnC [Vicinamibacterales bacterium]|nr:squalene synthase HpnC [Vicinamibacterales bacterium]
MVVDAAYATCLRLARAHYENFPVASRLLPRRHRPAVAAIYAFARLADDFADEGTRPPGNRLVLLDDWQHRLNRAVAGRPDPDDGSDANRIFLALADTIERYALEPKLFSDLLSAFRQDVTVKRYEDWEAVLDYCRRSANPVGRLVLRVSGYRQPDLDTASDAVCTALQLTNFWQDLERDFEKDRVYVPQAVVRRYGASEEDLGRRRLTPEWRAALGEAATRTRALFDAGRPVADGVGGRLRWELRATWLGGTRILDRLERVDFDVFHHRPTLGWMDASIIARRTLAWTFVKHA